MKKTLFALAPAALLLLTVGSAHAASSATLNVSGSVSAATCNLNLDRPNVNLGNTAPTGFTANEMRTAGQQSVVLSITDCSAEPEGTETAKLQVSGNTVNTSTAIFNNDSTPNVGVMVMNGTTPVAAGDIISVASGEDIVGATQSLNVGFASTNITADVGLINASVMFNLLVS